ncbi:hypothetical protein HQQ82_00405 [Rathayibacter sp. VKM Ac-2856]|uniref:hypothetical protein n=1 Tax=unclassified Rathayibacter TaxID=2609250 RepID=UPI001565BA4E|nr:MULTISPECIES: hypothetical protein [unclassified Rathayibacter]NQX03256.1 hypothetical protein [Rathayibacter sp. VKM Ac-2858]NQX18424.1 hypothetical protein [Rathayibacter sp. VKM Ac-2856]
MSALSYFGEGVSVAEWPTGEWVVDPATQVEWPVPEGVAPESVLEHARKADAGELLDLRFFVSWGTDGLLWDIEGPRESNDLGLSPELDAALSAWRDVCFTHCPVFEGWDGTVDVDAWEEDGAQLARRVQRELYGVARVLSSYGP